MKTIRFNLIMLLGALCLCLAAANKASAETYYVSTTGNDSNVGSQGFPFQSIQRGINAAANGDTVVVANGTYSGLGNFGLLVNGKNFTLRSQNGSAACIIDCQQVTRGFTFSTGSTAAMVVDGFTVKNGKVTEASGDQCAGGGVAITGSSPTFRNCVFADNQALSSTENQAAQGGAIVISTGNPVFESCRFERNIARTSVTFAVGGAISCPDSGGFTLTNCTFLSNQAEGVSTVLGGAVYIGAGQMTATDCRFEDNRITGQETLFAGAVYVSSAAQAALLRCDLINNRATAANGQAIGGAVVTYGGLSFTGCTISQNQVQGKSSIFGGGVAAINSGELTLTNTTVSGNSLVSNLYTFGGGLYLGGNLRVVLQSSSIVSNTALGPQESGGGGISLSGGVSLTATNCLVKGNVIRSITTSGISHGGGIAATGSGTTLTLNNTTCSENLAESEGGSTGGGIEVVTNARAVLRSSRLVFNRVQSLGLVNGGGISALDSFLTATNCLVGGNTARSGNDAGVGGGLFVINTPTTLTNTLIVNNVAEGADVQEVSKGGGLYHRSTSSPNEVTVTHCTITGNRAYGGSGISGRETRFLLTNSIVAANGSNPVQITYFRGSDGSAEYSHCCCEDFRDTPDANGNFAADPRFVRNPSAGADGVLATLDDDLGNLRLQSASPCINKATASAPNEPTYDFDGFVRIVGSAPDIGAYEFGSTVIAVAANLYVDKAAGNDTTGNGTASAPFQTVTKALSITDPTLLSVVNIKAGNYGTDRPRVTGKVRLVNWGNTGRASIGKP